jgi:very-short-patch-repair endonuclease
VKPSPSSLRECARRLRRAQTDAEGKLWQRLRGGQLGGAKFRRQHPIGPYITDFCCLERGLIVELDGAQHVEQAEQDGERTSFLEGAGYRVIRFWNNAVLREEESVVMAIAQALAEREGWRWGSGEKR